METMDNSQKYIHFVMGGENVPFIEENIKNAPLFREQYNQLLDRTQFYMSRQKRFEYANSLQENAFVDQFAGGEYANIIAISGDRGMGKTSVMLSLICYLSNHALSTKQGSNSEFLIIPPIDPSFFSDGSSSLQIIIAQLYKYFKTRAGEINQIDKNEILREFSCVKKCLTIISSKFSPLNSIDEIEDLESLSAAIDLRGYIKKLVSDLLSIDKKSMLLLAVDDIDLNATYAYDMLEQLRKYFTLPNILIFLQ